MANEPLLLYFASAAADRPFTATLAARLTRRGLRCVVGGEGPSRDDGSAITRCALFLRVVSRASNDDPAVLREQAQANESDKLVVPLIRSSRLNLPPELAALQWIDFSASAETGWLDLLMTLDSLGIAPHPASAAPRLDWDLALARAYRGRMPYSWRAYRISPTYYARQGAYAVDAILELFPVALCALGYLLDSLPDALQARVLDTLPYAQAIRTAVIVVALAIFAAMLLRTARPRVREAQRNLALVTDRSEIVIMTPEGFGIRTRPQTAVFQFADVAAITQLADGTEESAPDASVQARRGEATSPSALRDWLNRSYGVMQVTLRDGSVQHVALGARFPERAVIIGQILQYFRAFQEQQETVAASNGDDDAPRVFISYARKDRQAVDLLDMALQRRGMATWVDRNMLTGGQEWSRELQHAIERCTALVAAVSPNAMASAVVRQEYEHALRLGKPVLAVRLTRGGSIPPVLEHRLCADFARGVERSLRRGLAPLILALDAAGCRPARAEELDGLLVVARVLADRADLAWQVYRTRPPVLSGVLWLTAAIGIAPFALLPVMALLGVSNPFYFAGVAAFAALTTFVALRAIARRVGDPPLLIVTPEGLVSATRSGITTYPFRAYRPLGLAGARAAARAPAAAPRGSLLLALRGNDAGAEQVVRLPGFGVFPHPRRIAQQVCAAFERYTAEQQPPG